MRLILALCLCAAAAAQTAGEANSHYGSAENRARLGECLSSADRDRVQRGRDLVRSLAISPGMTVADIGTGSGYMLPFFSEAVGQAGRVLAEDVFPDFLAQARQNARKRGLGNIEFVLGTADDPKLPRGSVDLAFLLEVYHHLDKPEAVMERIRAALKPAGRLAVVDYYRRPGAMPGGDALKHIRADQPEVLREIEAAGFRLIEKRDHIPNSQYVLTFGKAPQPVSSTSAAGSGGTGL